MPKKWSKTYFADLGERVGATFLASLLGCITLTGATPINWNDGTAIWAVLGVPTLVTLIKGLLANMADPTSGPSLLPAPPAPKVDEAGAIGRQAAIGAAVVVLVIVVFLILGTRP